MNFLNSFLHFFLSKRGVLCLATVLGTVVFLNVAKVQAQSDSNIELGIPEGVQISPARFDLDLESGEEYVGKVNLKNYAEKSFSVKIEIEDFYVSDDSSEAKFFIPDEKHPLYAYDVINWIEIENSVELLSGEAKDIYYKIRVPENTPTGGYYGVIFFRTTEGDGEIKEGESKVIISQRVGSLVVMAIKGKESIERSGKIINFSSFDKIFFSQPAKLVTEIKNEGNLHYKVFGKLDITKFGKRVKTFDFNPRVLYPDRTRQYFSDWDFGAWDFGYYKAKADFFSEDEEISMSAETSFWVIPWKTTVSVLIIIIIIILITKLFTSKFEIRSRGEIENKKEKPRNAETGKEDKIAKTKK